MPEEVINNNNQPPVTPAGTNPTPLENGENQNNNNPENLTIPKHVFDQKNNELKEVKAALAAKEKAEKEARDQALTEQNKFKELAELREKELNETREQVKQTKLENAIERAAARAGAVDSEAVLALIDKSKIQVNGDGTIAGVEEAINALQSNKAYLFGKGNTVTLGEGTNPSDSNTQVKSFKLSQLQNAKFYRDNLKDIEAAQAAGTIVNDLPQ